MTYTLYLSANHDIYFLIQELRADLLRRLLGPVGADAQLQEAPEGLRLLSLRAPTTGTDGDLFGLLIIFLMCRFYTVMTISLVQITVFNSINQLIINT